MVHVIFDVNSVSIEDILDRQRGGAVYEGLPFQRGYGKGLRRGYVQRGDGFLDRILIPALKSVGKAVASEGLATGSRIISNLGDGKNLKEVALEEGKQGVKNLGGTIKKKMCGGKKTSVKRKRVVGRSVRKKFVKKRRFDNLGFY